MTITTRDTTGELTHEERTLQPAAMRSAWLHPDIEATLSAHPDDYSPMTSTSRWASLRYAVAGLLYVLRYQKNVRIQIAAALIVATAGLWVGLPPLAWAVLVVTILINFLAEMVNAAIEAAVNVASPDLHPMARVSKDVAAGAALLAALGSVVVGLLVIGPPLLERLSALLTIR
jgi:undecaprenol kinase